MHEGVAHAGHADGARQAEQSRPEGQAAHRAVHRQHHAGEGHQKLLGPGPGQQPVLQIIAQQDLQRRHGDLRLVAGAGQVVVPRQGHRPQQHQGPHRDVPAQGGDNVPDLEAVLPPVLFKDAVVGDKQQAEEGQGQQLGQLDPPEDAQLQHEIGGGQGRGGHHGPRQGDEHRDGQDGGGPGENPAQLGVGGQDLAGLLGGHQEEGRGQAGEGKTTATNASSPSRR